MFMTSPNCLCKLKYFTIYLRVLLLERAEWTEEKAKCWPLVHDLIAITTLACLKNEGFKLLRKSFFGWLKYDNEISLSEFRSTKGKLLISSRLNGFTKFITVFMITCSDGEIQLRGQVHTSEDKELEYYEMKAQENIAGGIHFALCGGYYQGKPAYLQYDITGLLNSIHKVVQPVREYITQNWQYTSVMECIKNIPVVLLDTMFGDSDKYVETVSEDIEGEGKIKFRHTNPEKLMLLSPEMCQAQVKSGLILYHYRDDEKCNINNNSSTNCLFTKKHKEPKIKNNNNSFLYGINLKNIPYSDVYPDNCFDFTKRNHLLTANEMLKNSSDLKKLSNKIITDNREYVNLNIDNILSQNKNANVIIACEELIDIEEENIIETKGKLYHYLNKT